jgi:hypothetical protein
MKPLLLAICFGGIFFVAGCATDDDEAFPKQSTSANADEPVPGATAEPSSPGGQAGWKW